MSESLVQKLDRLEKEISELKSNAQSAEKSSFKIVTDEHIAKVAKAAIDEKHVTDLYRNK